MAKKYRNPIIKYPMNGASSYPANNHLVTGTITMAIFETKIMTPRDWVTMVFG